MSSELKKGEKMLQKLKILAKKAYANKRFIL